MLSLRLALLFATVAAAVGAATAPPAGAVVIGIGDNVPTMFSDSRFLALGVHEARAVVPWDAAVTKNATSRTTFAAWLAGAKADGVTPLVSFGGDGNYVPSVPVYTKAVKAFIRAFPQVKRYTPWNEPDWIYRSLSKKPALAAGYFNALRQACKGCLVLAGDVYLPASQLGPWLRSYIKALKSKPQAWALHNYIDVRAGSTAQLQLMLKLTSGPLWLDETGGILRRGHWQYANQSAAAAAKQEQALFQLPKRFPRISRIYHYEWQGFLDDGWDSGLIGPDGSIRPAYSVVLAAAR